MTTQHSDNRDKRYFDTSHNGTSLMDLDIEWVLEQKPVQISYPKQPDQKVASPLATAIAEPNTANKSKFAGVFGSVPNHASGAAGVVNGESAGQQSSVFGDQSSSAVVLGPGAHIALSAQAIQEHRGRVAKFNRERGEILFRAKTYRDRDMDDYGRGDMDRRGGGGRKRRYREDDLDDRRQDYSRYPQKRRYEEPWHSRIRKQIFTIADSPLRNPQEDVVAISKNIVDHYEEDSLPNLVADNTLQLVVEQPFKIPFASAIVLYTNEQKPEFVRLVLEKSTTRMQLAIDAGDWRTFKLLLRFFGCLQPLFQGEGAFPLLEEMFNKAADLQTASSDDILGIELVKIIMLTIPYILASNVPEAAEQAVNLLGKTDIIASAPREMDSAIDPYVNLDSRDIPVSQSVVGMLQKQLQAESETGWTLPFLPKLFKPTEKDASDDSATEKHPFPAIEIPQTINPGLRPLFPELYFSLYADQDVETVPPTSSLAASLLRDALVDTINLLDFNRSACAKFLIDIDCYWAPGTFVKRATPFDKVREAAEGSGTSTWKPEDLAVDAIFSQMLQLPAPEHKLAYYHSLITEACKIAAGSIAPSLGRAIRYLYKNLELMDVELSYRYLDWFAHHLSNFDFRWKWVEWIDDVELTNLHPRKAFIVGVLDKEIRLSFAKRVRDTLPEQYHSLIPEIKDNDIPEFKYNNDVTPYSSEAKQIVGFFKRKAAEPDIQPVLDSIQELETNNAAPEPLLACIDAYVTALCYIGSKSLSHVLSYIERCKERLIGFGAASSGARGQIISSVINYWQEVQPGVAVNIVDKLLNYSILTPTSVVEWALAPENLDGGRLLAVTWVYEMVERTLGKVTGRVRQIVAARMQAGLPKEQTEVLDKALTDEAQAMQELFTLVDDGLAGVAEGAQETLLEQDVEESELKLLKAWGAKWRRVFARKLVVEQMVIGEARKMFPEPVEVVEGMTVDGAENGINGESHGTTNGGAIEVINGYAAGAGTVKDEEEDLIDIQ